MLKNETTKEFLNRIEYIDRNKIFTMFDEEERDFAMESYNNSKDHIEYIKKLKNAGFSEFKIGVAVTFGKIQRLYKDV